MSIMLPFSVNKEQNRLILSLAMTTDDIVNLNEGF